MDDQVHNTVTRVTKNIVAQIVALASTVVSKLLITIVIGRLFGAEQVGEFAFVMTFSLIFTFLATAGVPWSIIREVATHRSQARDYADNGLTIVTLTSLATIPLMIGAAWLLGRPSTTCIAVGLTGLALVFDGMAQIVCSVFNGFERMELASIVTIIQELAFLVIGAIVLVLHLPFQWLFVVYVPSRLAGLVVSLPLYRRLLGHPLHFGRNKPFMREMLRISMPYAANMALGPIYLRIDVVMLTFYQGNVAVGIYEAATSIFYRFNILARTINNALMPLMARVYESQADRIRSHVNAAAKYQTIVGIPLSVLCIMLARPLMSLLYGEGFDQSAPIFGLMASITTLRFVDNTLATALTAVNLQAKRSVAVALAAVFNVGINLWVLPAYSFTGAAITTILTEIVFFGVMYVHLRRQVAHPLAWSLFVKPALAGVVMAAVLWFWRDLPLLLLSLMGGGSYLIALMAMRTFSQQESEVFLQIIQRGLAILRSQGLVKRLLHQC
jgi:O-antigen/teichoic acid export membrane protein